MLDFFLLDTSVESILSDLVFGSSSSKEA